MTELFYKLKAEGNFLDAYIVAKNNLSRNIDNVDCFSEFIELALELAMLNIVFEERKQYVAEANAALEMFSESVLINEDVLQIINNVRGKIGDVLQSILIAEAEFYEAGSKITYSENEKHLDELAVIYKQIENAKNQEEFDKVLKKVSDVENKLNKESFSGIQEETYEKLTQDYSQLIAKKMEEINRLELLEYNKKAIKCFNDVFTAFKKEPSRYKDESMLKALMTTKFFSFDTSKLFNESLVFYNHVYSLVFQETSDKLKYKLTEWALNTRKLN